MAQPHSQPVTCPYCSSRNTRLGTRPPVAGAAAFQMECTDCRRSWPVTAPSLGEAFDPLDRVLMPGCLEMAAVAEFAAVLTVCSGVAIRAVPEPIDWRISAEWQSETLGAVLGRLEKVIACRVIDGNTLELRPIRD